QGARRPRSPPRARRTARGRRSRRDPGGAPSAAPGLAPRARRARADGLGAPAPAARRRAVAAPVRRAPAAPPAPSRERARRALAARAALARLGRGLPRDGGPDLGAAARDGLPRAGAHGLRARPLPVDGPRPPAPPPHRPLAALDRRAGGSVALVVYREEAFAVTPLTDDANVLREQVRLLRTSLVPGRRTLPARGIEEAQRILDRVGAAGARIVLVSDGED